MIRPRTSALVLGILVLLSLWIVWPVVRNQFSADYSAGLIFGVAAACLAATLRTRLEADRERREHHLLEADARAELLRLKASFINNMNHEIRTPLTGIIGFAEVIAEASGSEQRLYAHAIQRAGRRLMDTLTGILDLAHLESGGFQVSIDRVDVNTAVKDAVLLLENQASCRELALCLEFGARPLMAQADYVAVHRIVYNLLSNAIKFTDTGTVTVRTFDRGGMAYISVEDTGIGIDAVFLPHIFDEFKQASSGVNRSHEGTGLGLTVTKRLVQLMDGTIAIQSVPGAGSTFTVGLRRADAADLRRPLPFGTAEAPPARTVAARAPQAGARGRRNFGEA